MDNKKCSHIPKLKIEYIIMYSTKYTFLTLDFVNFQKAFGKDSST